MLSDLAQDGYSNMKGGLKIENHGRIRCREGPIDRQKTRERYTGTETLIADATDEEQGQF